MCIRDSCTIDPNVGVVPVPDERLDKLTAMYNSEKTTHAVIEFVDIAGVKNQTREHTNRPHSGHKNYLLDSVPEEVLQQVKKDE